MTLKLSKNISLNDLVTGVNPIFTQHINTGETKQLLVYLFNDDTAKRYENVVVTAVDSMGTNETSWVNFAHDNSGSAGSFSSSLSLGEMNESNSAKPFWIKVTNATLTQTQTKTDLSVKVSANEFAV